MLMFGDTSEEEGYNYRDPNKPPKASKRKATLTRKYFEKEYRASRLFEGYIDHKLINYLISVENVACRDIADGQLQGRAIADLVEPETAQDLRQKHPDLVIEDYFDPYADDWNSAWGMLPSLAINAAKTLAGLLDAQDIGEIERCMGKRRQYGGADGSRSWTSFLTRADPLRQEKQPTTAEALCIGWFADTYRSTGFSSRMKVDDNDDTKATRGEDGAVKQVEGVNMTRDLGQTVASVLKWLEALGAWFKRLRTFSLKGLDLSGNCARFAIEVTRLGGGGLEYQQNLTIFMWSEGEPLGLWSYRLHTALEALRTVRAELTNDLHGLEDELNSMGRGCGGRILFRPGFTVEQMNASRAGSDAYSNRGNPFPTLDRQPKVFRYRQGGDAVWEAIRGTEDYEDWSKQLRTLFSFVVPVTVHIVNLRQYQWHTAPLGANSTLSQAHLLAILYAVGPGSASFLAPGQIAYAEPSGDCAPVKTLDLACFIPLVQREGAPSTWDFFPLAKFPCLEGIAIPYTAMNSPLDLRPSTAELIMDKSAGLQSDLIQRTVFHASGSDSRHLTIYVTMQDARQVHLFKQELQFLLLDIVRKQYRRFADSNPGAIPPQHAEAKRSAREQVEVFIARALGHVHIINAQVDPQAMNASGKLRGTPLGLTMEWPADLT